MRIAVMGTITRMVTMAATMPMMAAGLKPSVEAERHEAAAGGAGGVVVDIDIARRARVLGRERCAGVSAIVMLTVRKEMRFEI
jgi:hypothetical protein